MELRAVLTFLWRTVYLQAVRRYYWYTALELIYVVVVFTAFQVPEVPADIRPLANETATISADDLLAFFSPTAVVFTPNTSYYDYLMRAVIAEIDALPTANLEMPLCVTFEPATTLPGLGYTIFLPIVPLLPWEDASLSEDVWRQAARHQYIIDKTHIKLQQEMYNSTELRLEINIQPLPGWIFNGLTTPYRLSLMLGIHIAFILPLIRRTNAIVSETSSGLAQYQASMGLSNIEFLLGHFITAMIFALSEGALIVIMFYITKFKNVAFGHGIDASLLSTTFLIFHIGHTLLAITLASLFPKGWASVMIGIVASVMIPIYTSIGTSVAEHFLTSRNRKLLRSLFPTTGLSTVLRLIFLARDYEGGAGWSSVTRPVLDRDNVTIMDIWAGMMLCNSGMVFMTWYLPKVLPWCSDDPENPFFFIKRLYRRPEAKLTGDITQEKNDDTPGNKSSTSGKKGASRFEDPPRNVAAVIVTKNLTKAFGDSFAVNDLNLKVYESKITIILGHNGSGKTILLHLLMGIRIPTSGDVYIDGLNVMTCIEDVRKRVGFCQETDIFFEDLTCWENLLYFGSMRRLTGDDLLKSVDSTLETLGMQGRKDSMPRELSGGMRRKLSLAMALVSNPKILILDEPTSGLDPPTRRQLWAALRHAARHTTVLLSSHSMEEADAIGDHIVVMSRGKVVCSGSRAFLRKSYGVGYKLALVKTPNTFDLKAALSTVHKTVPSAEVYDEDIDKVQISLNKTDLHNIPSLLDNLEDMRDKLGIASVRVTTATMEDVYAKANNDWMPEEKRRLELTDRLDIATICEPVAKKRTLFLCFRGLLVKRLMYLSRSWGFIAACFVVPLLNLLVVDDLLQPYPIFRQLFGLGRANEECIGYSEAGFGVQFPDTKVFLHEGRPQHSDMSLKVRVLVESDGGSIEPLEGAESELRRIGMEDFVTYMRSYSMAVIFRGNDTVLGMYNPTTAAALLVLLNVLQTALLRASTNVTTTRIGTRVAYGQFCSSKVPLIPNSDILRLYWVLLAASSYSIIFAAFVVFPLVERRCGARDLQLMSGIWGICFLLSHFVFDFICYTVVMALWCSLHYYLYTYSLGTAGSIFLVFVGFSPAVIFYGYLAAEFYSSVGTAFVATVMYVYVNGFLFVAFSYLLPPFLKNWVDYVMKLVPPYGLLHTLVKVSAKEIAAQECLRHNATLDPPASKKHVFAALRDGKIVPLDLISFSEKDYLLDPCAAPSAFAFTDDGIVFDLLCFMVQGILFCITASFFTSGNFLKWQSPTGREETAPENGVKKEEQLVTKLREEGQFSDHSVVAWNLQKSYGQDHVVKSFFLALRSSESFGLLGSNGAGKTTTFQMLAGLTSVSYGEAYSPVAILTDSTRLWQSQIGYCPQTGGLLDKLNIYEHLYLIGRLRGIDESNLKVTIDSVLSVVDLKDKSGRDIRSCSASDHRKLHIAIALLGLPPLLFLDEPFAALDLVSRNKISRALQAIRSRSSVSLLISSQNSADCESLCNRIAIMIAGRMMCLGTLQELKDKYGTGRRLKFQLEEERDTAASGSMEKEFIGAVLECFPGAKLALHKKSVFTFGLPDGLSWRELFRKLVELKAKFPIEDAKVADCTLEEIFLAFEKAYKTPECPVDAVEVSEESFHLTAVS